MLLWISYLKFITLITDCGGNDYFPLFQSMVLVNYLHTIVEDSKHLTCIMLSDFYNNPLSQTSIISPIFLD